MINSAYKFALTLIIIALTSFSIVFAQESTDTEQPGPFEGIISTEDNLSPIKLNLIDAMKKAVKDNLNIAIKKDAVQQAQLKINEARSNRLFYFFKFADANAVECSAKYSVFAAQADLQATTNDVIDKAATKYYNLLQTMLAMQVTQEFLKQGELSLKQVTDLYDSGKATKFEVNQNEVFVANLRQRVIESEMAYMVSSVDLAQYLNIQGLNTRVVPEEFEKAETENYIRIQTLRLIPENLLLSEYVDFALKNRQELDAISFQIKSLEELRKTTRTDEIKTETLNSQINQLKNSQNLLRNTIRTTVTQAVLKFIGAKNQNDVANQKFLLSKRALEQAVIMRNEGLITNKNVLDAQVDLAQSKTDYIKAIVNFNTSQVNLLREIGAINIDLIAKNEQVDITKLNVPKVNECELKQ